MGKIAQTGHMPASLDPSLRGMLDIRAFIESDPENKAIALERYPELRGYDSLESCLAAEQIDFVDICTPPHTHAKLVRELLKHDIHILCEKPFAVEESQAYDLARDITQHKNIVFMGCHQYRFSPLWKEFHSFREMMQPGEPFSLQFDIIRTEADPGLRARNGVWRTDKKISGGGILADTGVHYLYLCLWILGKPLRVSARTQTLLYTESSVEDTASVLLEYPNGTAQINLTWAADARANNARFLTRTRSILYDGTMLVEHSNAGVKTRLAPNVSDKKTYVGMYAALFREFSVQAASGRQRSEWIEEAYQSVQMLSTCYASAKQGTTISVV
jgi:predicted dehydrogenase